MPGMPLNIGLGCLLVVLLQILVGVWMKRSEGKQWPYYLVGLFNGGLFTYIFAVIEPDKPEVEYFGPKVRTFFALFSFKDVAHPEWLPPELVAILLYGLAVLAIFLTITFLLHQWPFSNRARRSGGSGGYMGNPGKGGGMPNPGGR